MTKVLLIEDDKTIARIILHYLEQEGEYHVTWAQNASEAVAQARHAFDVVLLDIILPEVNGIELCQTLRAWLKCPIIFISCLDDSETIISALDMGGDDYLVKPFDNKILSAKIRAVLRRAAQSGGVHGQEALQCPGFWVDRETQTLHRGEQTHPLLNTEFRILSFLMSRPRVCFNSGELYEQVWGRPSYGDSRTVMVHIHNLRRKIESDPKNPRWLKSQWGRGYYFDPDGCDPSVHVPFPQS